MLDSMRTNLLVSAGRGPAKHNKAQRAMQALRATRNGRMQELNAHLCQRREAGADDARALRESCLANDGEIPVKAVVTSRNRHHKVNTGDLAAHRGAAARTGFRFRWRRRRRDPSALHAAASAPRFSHLSICRGRAGQHAVSRGGKHRRCEGEGKQRRLATRIVSNPAGPLRFDVLRPRFHTQFHRPRPESPVNRLISDR